MTKENKDYTYKSEPWTISEMKESYVKCFFILYEKNSTLMRAKSGLDNLEIAKLEARIALYSFFGLMQKHFSVWFDSFKPKKNIEIEDYYAIQLYDCECDKLLEMINLIVMWANTAGPLVLEHKNIEYNDPAIQLKHENEM